MIKQNTCSKNHQTIDLEGDTDFLVKDFLDHAGISYTYPKTNINEIDQALNGESQSTLMGEKAEFIFVSGNHLFIVQRKLSNDKLESLKDGQVDTTLPARSEYAVNGAVHFAKLIIDKKVNYKEVIAIGVTGTSHYYQIQPYYVTDTEIRKLDDVKSFDDFSETNIDEYWRVAIDGEMPKIERELREVQQVAKELHEDLRNYGNLEGERKATVISAILLALEEETFDLKQLRGYDKEGQRDGDKIFNAIKTFIENLDWNGRYEKYGVLLDSFGSIRTDPILNTINSSLNMTPLHYYANKLKDQVVDLIKSNNDIDILGNFYGEFVRYGSSDGNTLGIVLTPRHITSLMAELIDVKPFDYVLDPACGTGAFLISAMQRMISDVENNKSLSHSEKEEQIREIKQHHLFGIELQAKLFTIATTNMILHGDGKSNLIKGDMFHVEDKEHLQGNLITKVLMNPAYSQAKTKNLKHLSEINFIRHALAMMKPNGKLAAIVPISTMVGKSKEEKQYKKQILEKNTLETVITLNTSTFHSVGVNPCICIFTSGIPHDPQKRVNFVDFTDDGYEVRKHVGLMGNGSEKSKRQHLLDVLKGNADDNTRFIVKTTIEPEDEWLHGFYYFNDELPTDKDFETTIADYLTFQFDMYSHGRGYLFEGCDSDDEH